MRNFLETFPLFVAVVVVAQLTDTHDALTEWGARFYFWARVAYVPLYAAGPLCSVRWCGTWPRSA